MVAGDVGPGRPRAGVGDQAQRQIAGRRAGRGRRDPARRPGGGDGEFGPAPAGEGRGSGAAPVAGRSGAGQEIGDVGLHGRQGHPTRAGRRPRRHQPGQGQHHDHPGHGQGGGPERRPQRPRRPAGERREAPGEDGSGAGQRQDSLRSPPPAGGDAGAAGRNRPGGRERRGGGARRPGSAGPAGRGHRVARAVRARGPGQVDRRGLRTPASGGGPAGPAERVGEAAGRRRGGPGGGAEPGGGPPGERSPGNDAAGGQARREQAIGRSEVGRRREPVVLRLPAEERCGRHGGGQCPRGVGQFALAHPAGRAAVEVGAHDEAVGGVERPGPVGVEVVGGEPATGPDLVAAEGGLLGGAELRPGGGGQGGHLLGPAPEDAGHLRRGHRLDVEQPEGGPRPFRQGGQGAPGDVVLEGREHDLAVGPEPGQRRRRVRGRRRRRGPLGPPGGAGPIQGGLADTSQDIGAECAAAGAEFLRILRESREDPGKSLDDRQLGIG